MLYGEIRWWILAPGVILFWGCVLGHVAQKHQNHFPGSSSFDDFDQRPPQWKSCQIGSDWKRKRAEREGCHFNAWEL